MNTLANSEILLTILLIFSSQLSCRSNKISLLTEVEELDQDNTTITQQCEANSCDADPDLIDLVSIFVDNAYSIYPEHDLCNIARYVKTNIERYTGLDGWVVLLGANRLLVSTLEFAAKFNHMPNTKVMFVFKSKHDILVFRARANFAVPYDLKPAGDLDLKLLARQLPIIDSDMNAKRQMNFHIVVNQVFNEMTGSFKDAAQQMYDRVSDRVCTGEWVFLLGTHNTLSNDEKFCAAYDRHYGTHFSATWRRVGAPDMAHEVIAFAPKTDKFCTSKAYSFKTRSFCG